jgi:xylan 1,4-beta-xylosidase
VAIIQRAGYPCASCCSGGDPQRWAASPWPAIPIKTEDEEAASAAGGGAEGADVEEVQPQLSTFCNPLNLGYRFRLEPPSRREAADPTMVVFDSTYFLFASKSGVCRAALPIHFPTTPRHVQNFIPPPSLSLDTDQRWQTATGGYWHSPDLLNWTLVVPKGLPLEDYAPTVVVLSGRLYFTSDCFEVWTTQDPKAPSALWTKVADLKEYKDPCLFLDAGKMYMYSGAGPNLGLNVVELDPANGWQEIGTPAPTVPAQHFREIGWDCRGDNNTGDPKEPTKPPSIEGSWMNKANGTYFMQFATPGTQYKTYSDALYTSTDARGPFMSALQNPFSHKPTGFLGGSGHGSTFQALDGQHWHVATSTISVRDRFERRLSLFPLHFSGAMMWADTWLGDYPIALPRGSSTGKSAEHMGRQRDPGWQLLSRNKSVSSSSHANATADPETGRMRSYGAHLAVDEDIRTWWSAATGDSGEWIQLDLGDLCQVASLQINFADEGSSQLGRLMADNVYQYYVEVSADNIAWVRLPQLDRTHNTLDMPHDYVQLHRKVSVRYLRLTCVRSAGGSNFSVSGLRVFGSCPQQPPPAKVSPASIIVMRDRLDRRRVVVSWAAAENADFYIVRYSRHQGSEGKHSDAITPSYMYHNYQVYGLSVRINALDAQEEYAFSVDSVNENGIASGSGTGVLTA